MTGPTIAFLPGFMQRGEAWSAVAERLAERYPSRLCQTPEDLPGPGAVAAGYSMGGRIALHAALADPARWRALVLVGVSAGVADPDARRAADERLAAWIETQPIEAVVARWEDQPVFATQSAELRAAQRPGRLSHDPAELARLLRARGQGAMPPVWDRLAGLRLPVLCVAGELDAAYVEAGRRMAELMPDARFEAVPGAGHAPQLERPALVAELLAGFVDERLGQ